MAARKVLEIFPFRGATVLRDRCFIVRMSAQSPSFAGGFPATSDQFPVISTGRDERSKPAAAWERETREGLCLFSLGDEKVRERHLTLRLLPLESPPDFAARAREAIARAGGQVVRQEIFGSRRFCDELAGAVAGWPGGCDWPVNWVIGKQPDETGGIHLTLIEGTPVRRIERKGKVVAACPADATARYCWLGGIEPADVSETREYQARRVFEVLESVLDEAGFRFQDLARTWLYLDDILSWYDGFNRVRTEFFRERRLRIVPASTGVGAGNPRGAALSLGGLAVRAADGPRAIFPMESPLQCSACDYGSSFSRAVETPAPGGRRVLVSGTASISPDGHTLHRGDPRRQISLTMEVARAILASRGLGLDQVSRATAYFKRHGDAPLFAHWCGKNEWACPPVVTTQAVVCRDDLLFEIELDAIAKSPGIPR